MALSDDFYKLKICREIIKEAKWLTKVGYGDIRFAKIIPEDEKKDEE